MIVVFLGVQALEMPYKGKRLSMIFLLPGEHSSLADLEDSMLTSGQNLSSLLTFSGHKRDVMVTVPKFKLESQLDLNEPLKNLGMTDMFDKTKADFSAMTEGVNKGLYVSQVVQKAFIEVNEEGAEATAASFGEARELCVRISPQFTCVRPFAFVIKDNLTGMILFSGHVVDPTNGGTFGDKLNEIEDKELNFANEVVNELWKSIN